MFVVWTMLSPYMIYYLELNLLTVFYTQPYLGIPSLVSTPSLNICLAFKHELHIPFRFTAYIAPRRAWLGVGRIGYLCLSRFLLGLILKFPSQPKTFVPNQFSFRRIYGNTTSGFPLSCYASVAWNAVTDFSDGKGSLDSH